MTAIINPTTAPTKIIVTILSKRMPGLTFNLDYFLSTHIQITAECWKQYGLIDATYAEVFGDSEFAFTITLRFSETDSWAKVMDDEAAMGKMQADVANFTNGTPIFVVGKVPEL
jgi:hypothetical protein